MLILRLHDFDVGESLSKTRQLVLLTTPRSHEFSAAALDRADHAINVIVAHSADGKFDVVLWRLVTLRRHLQRSFDCATPLAAKRDCPFRHASHHCCRPQNGLLQKIPPACKFALHFSSKPRAAQSHANQARSKSLKVYLQTGASPLRNLHRQRMTYRTQWRSASG
jgi:hypothetical protein